MSDPKTDESAAPCRAFINLFPQIPSVAKLINLDEARARRAQTGAAERIRQIPRAASIREDPLTELQSRPEKTFSRTPSIKGPPSGVSFLLELRQRLGEELDDFAHFYAKGGVESQHGMEFSLDLRYARIGFAMYVMEMMEKTMQLSAALDDPAFSGALGCVIRGASELFDDSYFSKTAKSILNDYERFEAPFKAMLAGCGLGDQALEPSEAGTLKAPEVARLINERNGLPKKR